jgi:transposase
MSNASEDAFLIFSTNSCKNGSLWAILLLRQDIGFSNSLSIIVVGYPKVTSSPMFCHLPPTFYIRPIKTELSADEYNAIKGTMWPYRKNKADLKPQEAELLDRLFAYAPSLKLAYDFREQLTAIFEQDLTKSQATQAIKDWRQDVETSQLTCFDPFLITLATYLDEITNYFLHRDSSGFVEGLNNKIKVLKRRCYGLLNLDHLFQRLFLDLEGYALFA